MLIALSPSSMIKPFVWWDFCFNDMTNIYKISLWRHLPLFSTHYQDVAHHYVNQESHTLRVYHTILSIFYFISDVCRIILLIWQRKGAYHLSTLALSIEATRANICSRFFFPHQIRMRINNVGVVSCFLCTFRMFAKDNKTAKQLLHLQIANGMNFSIICHFCFIGFDRNRTMISKLRTIVLTFCL